MSDIYSILPELLKGVPGPVILEIGAHYGQDTYRLRTLFPAATIYMFEPDPRNAYVIRGNLPQLKAELIEAAVGDRDGEAVFHLSSGTHPSDAHHKGKRTGPVRPWSQSSSLKAPKDHLAKYPWVKFEQTAKVKVVTLDTFFAQRGIARADFIWADVQGAEDLMLAGGHTALARTRYLYTEYANHELYDGQINLQQIMQRLPGEWRLLQVFNFDVLLENRALSGS